MNETIVTETAEMPAGSEKLLDYEMEQYWQCPDCFKRKRSNGHSCGPSWQHLVQYAVNHAINDYYMLPSEQRTAIGILNSLDKRWTNKVKSFRSKEHFERVQKIVKHYLVIHLLRDSGGMEPFSLFEKHSVRLPELDAELSMIVQVAEWGTTSFVLKKFIVHDDPNVVRAFLHTAVAICDRAFGRLPERIEVHTLLQGTTYTAVPVEEDVPASLDYLLLMRGLLQDDTDSAIVRH
ncbi:hypothetical protein [Paenibacillus sp. MBLB4367]|uniref:hypothetical protein n=1 Tax=Paenibacillus sp. MBLB4367 TaxID=3384767 RepID=UPI0039080671